MAVDWFLASLETHSVSNSGLRATMTTPAHACTILRGFEFVVVGCKAQLCGVVARLALIVFVTFSGPTSARYSTYSNDLKSYSHILKYNLWFL